MKKFVFFLSIICLVHHVQAQKKVASVNFSVSKEIGPGNLDASSELMKEIVVLAANENFDLQPVFDQFYNSFHNEFAKEFPFQLLPEDEVLTNAAYMAYDPQFENAKYHLSKPGYQKLAKPLLGIGKQDRDAMTVIFKDQSEGILMTFIGFEFDKTSVMGMGVAKIRAYFNMVCYDMDGKKVFDIKEHGNSKQSVGLVAGIPIMNKEKIQPMCISAAEELYKEIEGSLAKVVKKSAKNL